MKTWMAAAAALGLAWFATPADAYVVEEMDGKGSDRPERETKGTDLKI